MSAGSIPDPRIRPPRAPRAPVPGDQRATKHERAKEKNESINADIAAFLSELNSRATAMSERHDFSLRHALDLLLSAGVRTVTQRPGGNAYSAFLSLKSREMQEGKFLYHSVLFLLNYYSRSRESQAEFERIEREI
jgi:hypothetical protein